jgi:UDP-N-acetylglucosamine diphosphorylase/glucosamine-1-phosphate N-acetyltransferase
MKNIYIYENHRVLNLDPIVLTRPVFDLRTGLFTNLERIAKIFQKIKIAVFVRPEIADITRDLYPEFEVNPSAVEEGLWLDGSVIWEPDSLNNFYSSNFAFYYNQSELVAAKLSKEVGENWLQLGGPCMEEIVACFPVKEAKDQVVRYLWDAVSAITTGISIDLKILGLKSSPPSLKNVHLLNKDKIFIDKNVKILPEVIFDAEDGPIIISKGVQINPFAYIKGPTFIGHDTIISSHAKIRKCIIGPTCKIGGELKESIFQGWSNKNHGGHIGNAYIGQWVNIGAGTNNSNLKNTYESVKVKINDEQIDTGLLHVGSFIGDYSTFAIGARMNTGTIIGPGSSIISTQFPPNRIPPFHWFFKGKLRKTSFEKFIRTVETVQKRRQKTISQAEQELLTLIYNSA